MLAILCGVLAPMLNFAFAFGESIADAAKQQGATPGAAVYAVWPIALLGGLVVNVAYACWLLSRNKTWANFGGAWRSEAWAGCLMGVLWMAAMAVYGASSVYLGALGTSVGWALFQTFMIMTANLSGVLTGEWKQACRRPAPPMVRPSLAGGGHCGDLFGQRVVLRADENFPSFRSERRVNWRS